MTKSDLIARLAELNPHLYHRDVVRIVETVFDAISEALADGDRVELRGFGSFGVKVRGARQGRNPRTGKEVAIPPQAVSLLSHRQGPIQAHESEDLARGCVGPRRSCLAASCKRSEASRSPV